MRNQDQLNGLFKLLEMTKLPMKVDIKQHKPRRTLEQNSLMWKWHHEVAAYFCETTGYKWTAEDVHYYVFRPKFLGVNDCKIKYPKSSTQVDITEMSEALQRYEAWARSELFIELTNPDD